MSKSVFEYVGNLDTLIAVIIGAILATGGALVAEAIQGRRDRVARERNAASNFGLILSVQIKGLEQALRSQDFGERWGDITVLFFNSSLRELDWYDRNRNMLFDLPNLMIRSRIHQTYMGLYLPTEQIVLACNHIKAGEDVERWNRQREGAIDILRDNLEGAHALFNELEEIARARLECDLGAEQLVTDETSR